MPSQVSRIPRKAYELPLLKSLLELGGSVKLSKELYDLVAKKMGFAAKQMEYTSVEGPSKWVYDLQWAASNLRKLGEMDGSKKGVWKITEKGRERVRLEWDSFNLNDYISNSKLLDIEEPLAEILEEEVADELTAKFIPESLEAIKGQILIAG